jgi:tRNA-splicing endonuclease subunit Sen34
MLDIHVLRENGGGGGDASYLVFDLEESICLREAKRICVRLIGSYSSSSSKSQLTIASIPALLTLEEVGLLIENYRDEVNLLESQSTNELQPDEKQLAEFKCKYEKYSSEFSARQSENFRNCRREQLLSMKDKIIGGRRKKLTAQLTKIESDGARVDERRSLLDEMGKLESNFQLELEKIDSLTSSGAETITTNTEIFVRMPEFYRSLLHSHDSKIPTDQFWLSHEKTFSTCRYNALRYFWRSGFYLTSGTKFGGDFLVYPGDPSNFHSQFILVCVEDKTSLDSFSLKQLITYARMATSVKKTFLIAYYRPEFQAESSTTERLGLISLNWSHI